METIPNTSPADTHRELGKAATLLTETFPKEIMSIRDGEVTYSDRTTEVIKGE